MGRRRVSRPVVLGQRSNAPLADVAAALACAPAVLGTPDVIAVRSILVRPGNGQWTHLRTVLRVGEGEDLPAGEILEKDLGDIRLVGMRMSTADVLQAKDLADYLTFWSKLVQTPRSIRDQTNVSWNASPSPWSEWPCWRVELTDEAGTTGWANDPRGPFFKPGTMFAVDIAAAVRQWLREPARRHDGVSHNSYSVIIPDRRARIQDLQMDGTELTVVVDTTGRRRLFCATEVVDLDGKALTPQPVEITDGKAVVQFPRALGALEVYILDDEGDCLDAYSETGGFSWWGRSVLNPRKAPGDPAREALEQARELGEGQRIEFKEWIPPTRSDPKTLELLKTVVAFANADGGTTYIGVTDDAEVVGVTKHLHKAMGKTHGGELEGLRDAYVMRLRRLIAEGVLPQVVPEVAWVQEVGHWVLQVSVGHGADPPYHLAENNQFYIRRGATNRRMSREELQKAFVRFPQLGR